MNRPRSRPNVGWITKTPSSVRLGSGMIGSFDVVAHAYETTYRMVVALRADQRTLGVPRLKPTHNPPGGDRPATAPTGRSCPLRGSPARAFGFLRRPGQSSTAVQVLAQLTTTLH